MEKVKKPSRKKDAEQILDWEQESFESGTYLDPPASEISNSALVKADDCKVYPGWVEGRTGSRLWTSTELPTLPGRTNYEATKSGDIITKTAGTDFTASDVDNYFIWPNDDHEQIIAFISATQVQVHTSTVQAPATAASPASIRGPVHAWKDHTSTRRIVMQIDTRVFYSDVSITAWNEVYRKSITAPISDVSVMSEWGDFMFLFNSNGIFKIDLGLTIPEMIHSNADVPQNTIVEVAATNELAYGRRYIVAMSRILGSGDRDRTTSGAVIKQESGVEEPDPTDDFKDYKEIFSAFPFGSVNGTYEKLTCGATTRTFTEWTTFGAGQNQLIFQITLNGSPTTGILIFDTDLASATSFDDIATAIQTRLRAHIPLAPDATCTWVTDHFEITGGTDAGSTAGFVITGFVPTAAQKDISGDDYMNGRDPALGGNGALSDITINNVVGPLTVPTGEQQWTHYSVYGPKDTGVNGALNDPNDYVWLDDVPIMKAFSAARDALGNIVSSQGAFGIEDVGSVITFSNGVTDTIATYVSPTQVTGTAGAAVTAQGASIGGTKTSTASQSGITVTRTAGDVFVLADVGKTLYWADGFYVYVTAFVDNNNVTVAENQNHVSQGLGWDPTSRSFNDTVSDAVIENRFTRYQLQQRFWQPLPIINAGNVVPGFMFVTVRDTNRFYYSQMSLGVEYLAGNYNPAFQYEILDDSIKAFAHFPDMNVVYCSKSTRRIPINVVNTVTVPGTNAVIATIAGVTIVDSEIGCLDFGSIQNVEEGKQIIVTSEPGVRIFDGYRYSANLALDQKGYGHMLGELRTLQASLASSYDPIDGYIIWGTNQAL